MEEQQSSHYRYVIAGLSLLLYFSGGLTFLAVAPVLPLIQEDYGINRGTASLLIGLVILMQAVFPIPGGVLVGRLGVGRVFTVGWLLASAPVLSFLVPGFFSLLLLRIMFGASFALLLPATGPLLIQWFRPREFPLVNSLNLVALTTGIAVSAFSAAPLAGALGWQGILSLYGGLMLAGAVAWMVLGRTHDEVRSEVPSISFREVWGVLRSRTTLLLAVADIGPYAQYVALTSWLPTYYHEEMGMSLAKAGVVVGLLPLAGVVSLLLAGVVALRVERRKPFLIIPGVLVGFAGFGSFLAGEGPLLYVMLALLGFCTWFYLPILFTIPMELPGTSQQQLPLVWAMLMTSGSAVSFVAPTVVGSTTDILGTYLPGFSLWAVLSWGLLIGGMLLPEPATARRGHGSSLPPSGVS